MLVESGQSLAHVARYIEANGRAAGLMKRAEHYKWSSASPYANDPGRPVIADWPIERPTNWLEYVNSAMAADEVLRIQRSIRRRSPYGSDQWIERVAAEHGLESTLRPLGRPRVYEAFLPTE